MKKLLSLLGVSLTLMFVSSCSSIENRISLAMNVDAFLTDLDNQYAAPEVDKISANLEINAIWCRILQETYQILPKQTFDEYYNKLFGDDCNELLKNYE